MLGPAKAAEAIPERRLIVLGFLKPPMRSELAASLYSWEQVQTKQQTDPLPSAVGCLQTTAASGGSLWLSSSAGAPRKVSGTLFQMEGLGRARQGLVAERP